MWKCGTGQAGLQGQLCPILSLCLDQCPNWPPLRQSLSIAPIAISKNTMISGSYLNTCMDQACPENNPMEFSRANSHASIPRTAPAAYLVKTCSQELGLLISEKNRHSKTPSRHLQCGLQDCYLVSLQVLFTRLGQNIVDDFSRWPDKGAKEILKKPKPWIVI